MRKTVSGLILSLLVTGMLALAIRIQPIKADDTSAEVVDEQLGLKLTMTLENTVYSLGEPINITLTLTNISNQTTTIELSAYNNFDFRVYNDTNSTLYQWSNRWIGVAVPQVIWLETLNAGESLSQNLVWNQTCYNTGLSEGIPVSPGAYYIVGQIGSILSGKNSTIETVPIQVIVVQPLSLVPLKTVVGQEYNLRINVTVMNSANSAETFNVTVLSGATVIGTEVNVDVSNGTLATLNFTWNTTGLGLGKYTMSALAGNVSAAGSITVTIPGDLNGDFKVNLQDLVSLASAYGSKPGDSNWNPNADIDNSGTVGLSDLVILAQHYGQHYP